MQKLTLSREEWGSELSFLTVQLDGTYFQKIGEESSLGFSWKGASDLSNFNLGLHESPAFYKPNLFDRILFHPLL
ncbi:hypothetical protein MASR2M78_07460 [Treponema sp.]